MKANKSESYLAHAALLEALKDLLDPQDRMEAAWTAAHQTMNGCACIPDAAWKSQWLERSAEQARAAIALAEGKEAA